MVSYCSIKNHSNSKSGGLFGGGPYISGVSEREATIIVAMIAIGIISFDHSIAYLTTQYAVASVTLSIIIGKPVLKNLLKDMS